MGSPALAERSDTWRSPAPKFGAVILPPDSDFVVSRFNEPPTQQTPWPKPPAESEVRPQFELASPPPEPTLTRSVVDVWRSRSKASKMALVSLATRLVAPL